MLCFVNGAFTAPTTTGLSATITCPLRYDPCIMAIGLEEAWQNLSLTAEEEQYDERVDFLCLLGLLHTTLAFNPRALKSILRNVWKPSKGLVIRDPDTNLFAFQNVWKPSKGLVIRDPDTNLFAFQFFSAADKDFVLNQGPWDFNGGILLLQQMTNLEVPSEVEFCIARFWVKAYDVPGEKQTISFAQVLASNTSTFVSCDEATMFRVGIDISKPLRRGIHIQIADKQLWIRFNYVKLSEFCYRCGKLGHVLISCDLISKIKDEANLQYGAWMHASPLKSRCCNA
ncbi:hypothetical protein Cgig2_005013 [Carnegiea gigantea]|uniref:CCHC-type domain-containing protein n=1 Tax=Carnegiea gigantea TaxID=171969 RepID=A0A9Q1KZJ9_9CARY|nr:hypothetical protein Cgig2_005013 [Carnegiea gigantea]